MDSVPVQYLAREYPTMKMSNTSSAALVQHRGKDGVQFQLSPDHLDFGNVPAGTVVQRTLTLHNVSLERSRFTVQQAALPLHVIYKPAPVPAGLSARITVEFVAMDLGAFCGDVVVKSEVNVLTVPVTACVLPGAPDEEPQELEDARDESAHVLSPAEEDDQALREAVDQALSPVVLDETFTPPERS